MRVWLKEIRTKKGYTQQDIASRSNISRSFYTHIEAGNKNPTVDTAKSIANSLDIDWTLFFESECSLKEQNLNNADVVELKF